MSGPNPQEYTQEYTHERFNKKIFKARKYNIVNDYCYNCMIVNNKVTCLCKEHHCCVNSSWGIQCNCEHELDMINEMTTRKEVQNQQINKMNLFINSYTNKPSEKESSKDMRHIVSILIGPKYVEKMSEEELGKIYLELIKNNISIDALEKFQKDNVAKFESALKKANEVESAKNDLYTIENVQKQVDIEKKIVAETQKIVAEETQKKSGPNKTIETTKQGLTTTKDQSKDSKDIPSTNMGSVSHKENLLLGRRFTSPMEEQFQKYILQMGSHGYTLDRLQTDFFELAKITAKTCIRLKCSKLALEYLYHTSLAVYGESFGTLNLRIELENATQMRLLVMTESFVDIFKFNLM